MACDDYRMDELVSFDGGSNFSAWMHCAGGSDLVQNEIGVVSGGGVVAFDDGPSLWEVEAIGKWSVTPRGSKPYPTRIAAGSNPTSLHHASYAAGITSEGLISLRPPQKTLVYLTGMPASAR